MKCNIIFIIINIILIGIILLVRNHPKQSTTGVIHDTIEIYIDKIQTKIDTIYIVKNKYKYIYEEKKNQIDTMSNDSLWKYYTEFLQSRFPSDSVATKAN